MTGQPFVTIDRLDNGKYQIRRNAWIVAALGIINKRYMHTPTWPHPAFSAIENLLADSLGEWNTLDLAERAFNLITEAAVSTYMASGVYAVPGEGIIQGVN